MIEIIQQQNKTVYILNLVYNTKTHAHRHETRKRTHRLMLTISDVRELSASSMFGLCRSDDETCIGDELPEKATKKKLMFYRRLQPNSRDFTYRFHHSNLIQ